MFTKMVENKNKGITSKITLPEGVTAQFNESVLTLKGPAGETSRKFLSPIVKIQIKDNAIEIAIPNNKRKLTRIFFTLESHIRNMITGVKDGFTYELKICSGHFPMTVKKENNQVIITNFLGEKIPRKSKIEKGVDLEIKGEKIIVKSTDIEKAGQTAANIERATIIKKRDVRIFQDGCYIISKPQ